jgi:hypothetical protein
MERPTNSTTLHERFNLTIGELGAERSKNSHEYKYRVRHSRISLQETLEEVDEQTWYSTYRSTTTLLVLAHAFYLKHLLGVGKQPRRRHSRSRQTALVNYHKVVRRKQFHLLLGAVFSHTPPNTETNTNTLRPGTSIPRGLLNVPPGNQSEEQSTGIGTTRTAGQPSRWRSTTFTPTALMSVQTRLRALFHAANLETGTTIRGLTLLFYCAHCLWACRALEVIYPGTAYVRVLWTLTWTAFVVDLAFTRMALGIVREMNFGTSSPLAMGASLLTSHNNNDNNRGRTAIASKVEQTLTRRSVGGLTATTAAVLFLFQDHFDAPIPVLPFLSTKGPVLGTAFVSWLLVIAILSRLSQSTHPVMGVACGTISGLLWVSGWTFWLAEPYWCRGTLLLYFGVCLLSLKVRYHRFIPCVDYAPWDVRGDLVMDRDDTADAPIRIDPEHDDSSSQSRSSHGDRDDEDDEEHDAMELAPLGRQQLMQRRISSSSINFLTEMIQSGEDLEDHAEAAPLLPAVAASMTMRSRRAPGSTRT